MNEIDDVAFTELNLRLDEIHRIGTRRLANLVASARSGKTPWERKREAWWVSDGEAKAAKQDIKGEIRRQQAVAAEKERRRVAGIAT